MATTPNDSWERTFTFSASGGASPTIEITLLEGGNFAEFMDAVRSFALAIGYHPETVQAHILDE